MNTYKFKTNINCGGCVAKVTPVLDQAAEIRQWNVDISNPDKVLTVETDQLNERAVEALVKKAGFSAEPLK